LPHRARRGRIYCGQDERNASGHRSHAEQLSTARSLRTSIEPSRIVGRNMREMPLPHHRPWLALACDFQIQGRLSQYPGPDCPRDECKGAEQKPAEFTAPISGRVSKSATARMRSARPSHRSNTATASLTKPERTQVRVRAMQARRNTRCSALAIEETSPAVLKTLGIDQKLSSVLKQ
jgi:hypothetical protein